MDIELAGGRLAFQSEVDGQVSIAVGESIGLVMVLISNPIFA